jgi:3-methyladenine DNA glycosylase AlkD
VTARRGAPASAAVPSPDDVRGRLRALADPDVAAFLARYFRTGPGEYGEGDRFLGIRVPVLRTLSREFRGMRADAAAELLRSEWHEERLMALLILVDAFDRGDAAVREEIFHLYLCHTRWVDNWDLVDLSAPRVVGAFLEDGDRGVLEGLARSESVWERRIAVLATFHFIRRGELSDTLRMARALLDDPHDLIHKAVGWMLREVGKRDLAALDTFLREHAGRMPRTMLRYATEKLPEAQRRAFRAVRRADATPSRPA